MGLKKLDPENNAGWYYLKIGQVKLQKNAHVESGINDNKKQN